MTCVSYSLEGDKENKDSEKILGLIIWRTLKTSLEGSEAGAGKRKWVSRGKRVTFVGLHYTCGNEKHQDNNRG